MDRALKTARVALVGNPNSGKTALFNALTGAHQKVANYAGVTVERKEGLIRAASGRTMSVLDLPGTYSLRARSPDEEVTRDAVLGRLAGETPPDVVVCVADATNLRLILRLVLPQLMPRLLISLRLVLGSAWLFLIAAEAIASTDGLGYRIFLVRRYMAMDVILPYVAWIPLLAWLMDLGLRQLTRLCFPWYEGAKA